MVLYTEYCVHNLDSINYLLIAATFLQSDLCVLAGRKWFSWGISGIPVSRAVMVGALWPACPLEGPISTLFFDFSVANRGFSTLCSGGELWRMVRKKWSLTGSDMFMFNAGKVS